MEFVAMVRLLPRSATGGPLPKAFVKVNESTSTGRLSRSSFGGRWIPPGWLRKGVHVLSSVVIDVEPLVDAKVAESDAGADKFSAKISALRVGAKIPPSDG